jgi:cysteinyl-tRNA synthetase
MKLYNTLTNKKEDFVPLTPGKVSMYVCGPTVYNFIHIGNARPFVMFDVVRRYFEYRGYEVNYVQNYTDIDDKIIKRANEEGISTEEVSEKYIKEVEIDAKGLGVHPATHHPKATEEIDGIIEMISELIDKNAAYVVNGTVYFDSTSFQAYGKLSKKVLDELEAGKRIAVEDGKKNNSDFVLWKPKKEGEPFWPSPWSDGRPGWHIECSVMAKKYLGNQIDIHCGGTDLIFPHHENEIAQSETANGEPFATYWMHNGFINVDNQKMSKSLGNFFTVRDIVKEFPYEIIRMFLLNAHYRSPINFSKELMESTQKSLERIKNGYRSIKGLIEKLESKVSSPLDGNLAPIELTVDESGLLNQFKEAFEHSMDDDFNTSGAIAVIFDLVKYANLNLNDTNSLVFVKRFSELFIQLCDILGIGYLSEEVLLDADIEALIEKRQEARRNKDFAMSDMIRDQLLASGIVLQDTREGVKFKRA